MFPPLGQFPRASGCHSGRTRYPPGREHLQRVMSGAIQTSVYFDAPAGEPGDVIEQAAADGNTVIFTTSPRL